MKPYYEESGITIYHGDCRTILPQLGPVDVVITDPPYGIAHASNHGASWNGRFIEGDCDTGLRDWLLAHWPGPALVFGSWKIGRPAHTRSVLIWDKGPASGMGDLSLPWKNSFEEIYVIGEGFAGRRDEGVLKGHFQITWETQGRCHQNQKPESLLKALALKTAGTILDPFMGSGTTLVAAKNLGRKAIGIEIKRKYCDIAIERLCQGVLLT